MPCSESILDLLTPTDAQHALQWRARCRENTANRRAKAAKPSLMADAERDLGTRLDWVAADHWNTEQPLAG